MSSILEAPAAPVESPSADVLDVSLFDAPQRAVQYLQYAGLLKDNNAVTALGMAKRVNHAAFSRDEHGATPAYQLRFKEAMQREPDVAKLAAGGTDSPVFQLVDEYLTARADRARYAAGAWAARKAWYASQWAARKAWYDGYRRHHHRVW